jgi:hypothetical protein
MDHNSPSHSPNDLKQSRENPRRFVMPESSSSIWLRNTQRLFTAKVIIKITYNEIKGKLPPLVDLNHSDCTKTNLNTPLFENRIKHRHLIESNLYALSPDLINSDK